LGSFDYQYITQETGFWTGFYKRENNSLSAPVANVLNGKLGMAHIAPD
jgi:hypothetical protein